MNAPKRRTSLNNLVVVVCRLVLFSVNEGMAARGEAPICGAKSDTSFYLLRSLVLKVIVS